MWRMLSVVLFTLCLSPGVARALEVTDARILHGVLGVERQSNKFLPYDFVFMTYDIKGLKTDKEGVARYIIRLIVKEKGADKGSFVFKRDTPTEQLLSLGGDQVPGITYLTIGGEQQPGSYVAVITVTDKATKKKASYSYDFEILQKQFGIVEVSAPALNFPGQTQSIRLGLVELGLDKKKTPDVEGYMKIYDSTGGQIGKITKFSFPKHLPSGVNFDKKNYVPLEFPIYLNRPGQFTIEIVAHDKILDKTAKIRLPLRVLELSKFGK